MCIQGRSKDKELAKIVACLDNHKTNIVSQFALSMMMRLVSWCTLFLSTRSSRGYILKPSSHRNIRSHRSPATYPLITVTTSPSRRSSVVHSVLHAKAESQEDDTDIEQQPEEKWLLTLVIPLWLVYISNQWSRSSIYYLVDFSPTATETTAMNVALHMDESQYAILASVAFTSLFAIASVVLGNVRTYNIQHSMFLLVIVG